jgi:hypothetical protein
MLISLLGNRPLTFLFSRPLLEGRRLPDPRTRRRTRTTHSWDELWRRMPRFRRVWRVTTVIWGAALPIDAALRVVMAYTLPLDAVPGLGAALWPTTFILLQVVTNVYFARAGMWHMLHGQAATSQAAAAGHDTLGARTPEPMRHRHEAIRAHRRGTSFQETRP